MGDNKNLFLAIVLSLAILLGYQALERYFNPPPPPQTTSASDAAPSTTPQATTVPQATGAPQAEPKTAASKEAPTITPGSAPQAAPAGATREQILAATPRVRIDTPSLKGSIALVGARLDDLLLIKYHQTIDPKSPPIVLLSPQGLPDAYFAESGWNDAQAGVAMPTADTVWTADADVLTQDHPVTLSWDNGHGLRFERVFGVDKNYMFTVTQRVVNTGSEAVTLYPYALVSRRGTPKTAGFRILHEGPIGVFNDTLEELSYDDLKEKGVITYNSTGGWIGFTGKYWLSALIPEETGPIKARFVHHMDGNINVYQVDYLSTQAVVIPPGGVELWEGHIFAGAKVESLLDQYAKQFSIPLFDRAIDFGWFYFLTKPLFLALVWITDNITNNFGISILIITVLIKLLFFPLANKSYRAMSQMRKLQPEMTKLRERFADDKARLNQEMMALYKREKVSPAAGCLPMLIQIPVFFALYKVLFVSIEMRQAPFFGWIQDLSAPDPTNVFTLFGLIPWAPPDILHIGAWPLIMGTTMFLQQRLNPQPPDPLQAKIFMALPVVFTIMLAHFPAGLVIYWTWNNILSAFQQWVIMRRMGVKP